MHRRPKDGLSKGEICLVVENGGMLLGQSIRLCDPRLTCPDSIYIKVSNSGSDLYFFFLVCMQLRSQNF